MTRLPPSQQLDQLVQELRHQQDGAELTIALFRAGAREMIQKLLEAEVTEQLGREDLEIVF